MSEQIEHNPERGHEHDQEHPRGPSAVLVQRVIAAIALGVAFLVLGSVFAPEDTSASPGHNGHDASEHAPGHESNGHESDEDSNEEAPPANAWGDVTLTSSGAHADLPVLGTLEGGQYRLVIYGTDAGPRYTVYEAGESEPAAMLLDRKALARLFPDLPLPSVAGNDGTQLMYVDQEPTPH